MIVAAPGWPSSSPVPPFSLSPQLQAWGRRSRCELIPPEGSVLCRPAQLAVPSCLQVAVAARRGLAIQDELPEGLCLPYACADTAAPESLLGKAPDGTSSTNPGSARLLPGRDRQKGLHWRSAKYQRLKIIKKKKNHPRIFSHTSEQLPALLALPAPACLQLSSLFESC